MNKLLYVHKKILFIWFHKKNEWLFKSIKTSTCKAIGVKSMRFFLYLNVNKRKVKQENTYCDNTYIYVYRRLWQWHGIYILNNFFFVLS